jgi:lipopolysaccharide/colanic/teichoic acid biosynthesis glycosyltransferase
MQRLLDILLSLMALLILLPLLVPIVILLRLTGEGEVFFLQGRVGKDGRTFKLYKFATMLKNSPSIGTGTVTVKGDPRILPMGHFLRKSKVNELPQLLNILKGDMSIVGPRPQTQRCFDAFTVASQKAIVQVQPGITGIGSIIFHDEENVLHGHDDSLCFYDEVIAPYKGSLEEWYVANQGLRTYLACIGVTAWVVLSPASNLAWRVFRSLPPPPDELQAALLWSGAK